MEETMRLLYILALVPSVALANPINDNCPQHTIFGAPISQIQENTQYICHTNYAIHYRYDTKTAEYVVEHIDNADITGPAKRKDDFRRDDQIPEEHSATLEDYSGEPYDRGHLVPGANNKANPEIMSESFFLSNMVPQVPNHNRGIWRILELKVRDWALENRDLYVVSGTIYEDGYKTIGDGKVGVPTYLWKVVYDGATKSTVAYVLPNVELPVKDLPNYITTVDRVEELTGLNIFPQLDEATEAVVNYDNWTNIKG
jgi:endonuclease G